GIMPGWNRGWEPSIWGVGVAYGATAGPPGAPGNGVTTAGACGICCGGTFTFTGSSSSSAMTGAGGRWNGCGCGDGAAPAATVGALLVARMVMRSYAETPATLSGRVAAMYPAAERSTISSASRSGLFTSCNVTGP